MSRQSERQLLGALGGELDTATTNGVFPPPYGLVSERH